MKRITTTLAMAFVWAFAIQSNAQEEEPKTQMLSIHVDHVITSEAANYEEAAKSLRAALEKYNIKDVDYFAFTQSNGDYLYVDFIENYAALDKDLFQTLKKNMPKEEWEAMWKKFHGAYLQHESFTAHYHPDLSYKAEGLQEKGMNYRVWDYLYFEDKYWDNINEISKKWKDLYASKNIETGYTVYTSGFGYNGPVLVIHDWAKSPAEYQASVEKEREVLGEEAEKLWQETSKYIYKTERYDGWLRPDLSYTPAQDEQAVK